MLNIFKTKTLDNHLLSHKKIKVCGMYFTIRKINPLDYLEGSQVLQRLFDIYATSKDDAHLVQATKHLRKYYIDVMMAGIIEPKLSREQMPGMTLVDNLLTDWELATELVESIIEYTYGKKNFQQYRSQGKKS